MTPEFAGRKGYELARAQIFNLLEREIEVLTIASTDMTRTPTDRTLQRCFAEMYDNLWKKIRDLNCD